MAPFIALDSCFDLPQNCTADCIDRGSQFHQGNGSVPVEDIREIFSFSFRFQSAPAFQSELEAVCRQFPEGGPDAEIIIPLHKGIRNAVDDVSAMLTPIIQGLSLGNLLKLSSDSKGGKCIKAVFQHIGNTG